MEGLREILTPLLQQQQQQQQQFQQMMQQQFIAQQQEFAKQIAKILNAPSSAPVDLETKMDALANAITEFIYDPENGLTFDAWYVRYRGLFSVDARALDDAAKVRLLLRKLSMTVHTKYVNYILPKEYTDFDFANTIKNLTEMFGKKISRFHQRYNCINASKLDQHDFLTYAGLVNKRCEEFQISTTTANQFKCLMFICGLRSPSDTDIRTKLLHLIDIKSDSLTVQDLAVECQRMVNLKHDNSMVQNQTTDVGTVALVQSKNFHKKGKFKNGQKEQGKFNKNKKNLSDKKPSTPCWFCGNLHFSKDCTFKTHKCKKCKVVGHRDGYCASSKKVKPKSGDESSETSVKTIHSVNHILTGSSRKYIDILINSKPVKLQLDTGSDLTIISNQTWIDLDKPSGTITSHVARDASSNSIHFTQEFTCTVTFQGVTKQLQCFVTSNPALNIMGLDWISAFNLWNQSLNTFCHLVNVNKSQFDITEFQRRFQDVFASGLGRCTKVKVKLYLKPDAKPIFKPKRPVAYAILPQVDAELDRLEQNGIISPIKYSEWATPIVVVRKKNGLIRICADFSTGLNASLEPNRHPLPLPDEIFSQLSNCKYFSHLDLADAFLQIEIDDESKKFLTINTHRGFYVYNRMPFGVTVAPGEFQAIMDSMISGLPNVFAYIDDLVVGGETILQHNRNLTRLLERIQDYGFRLRLEKCTFFTEKINYLGYIIDGQGLHPDPKKVSAIIDMPAPKNLNTLRSFLGAINYYSRFIPNMHILRRPLDNLLKKDVPWSWSSRCQKSFEQFKKILTSNLLLTHYNPKYEIIVAADASNEGLGACILHRFPDQTIKAVSHAARSLTPAEKNYSQIEKEALAIMFAITKFHRMIFGRHFTLQTDHKPLLQIFGNKKGISVHSANRLQRWALQLLSYDFQIEYIKTTEFGHADVLSRLIDQQNRPEEDFVIASIQLEEDLSLTLQESLQTGPVAPITFQQIQEATKKSDILQEVIKYTLTSWPQTVEELSLQPYFRRRHSLSVVQGCLSFNDRIVVPSCFRTQVLRQIHKGHPGIERMKILARSYVYWPKIDADIEQFVKRCRNCALTAKAPVKVPLCSWTQPAAPWQRVHIDYAGPLNGEYFFVLVDAYSKWPEVIPTQSISAQRTISLLQSIFARFGIPETIVSDNGTQFISEKFQSYCLLNGIQHLRSPPFHPSSNGQAERFVDTFKRGLAKLQAEENSSNFSSMDFLSVFLQCYRSIPNSNVPNKLSPAEALMGRRIRTSLDLLKPSSCQVSTNEKQLKQEMQYNRKHGARDKVFAPGTQVFVQVHAANKWSWIPGKIIERVGKVLYNVLVQTRSRLVRAHANQLKFRHGDEDEKELPSEILINVFDLTDTIQQQTLQETQQVVSHHEALRDGEQKADPVSAVSTQQQVDLLPQVPSQQQVDSQPQSVTQQRETSSETLQLEHRESTPSESLPASESARPIRQSARTRRSPIRYKDYVCQRL